MTNPTYEKLIEKAAKAICAEFFDAGDAHKLHPGGVEKQGTRENYVNAYWYRYQMAASYSLDATPLKQLLDLYNAPTNPRPVALDYAVYAKLSEEG